jgi:AcrR family transcriptional regulator
MSDLTGQASGSTAESASPSPADGEIEGAQTIIPLRADAARNRARVVAAATEAFAEEGIAVPMEVIAKRAGVGVATIYRQFPTKESLFLAVVQHEMQHVFAVARELEQSDDPAGALGEFVGRLLETVAAKRDVAQALDRSGFKPKESPEVQQVWRDALTPLVERARSAGAVREDLTADDVLFLISGACSAVVSHAPDEAARQRMGRVLCDGFRPTRAASS